MKHCRCGEPGFGHCGYCHRVVCVDCIDAHDTACTKRPRPEQPGRIEPRVTSGAMGATEDAT